MQPRAAALFLLTAGEGLPLLRASLRLRRQIGRRTYVGYAANFFAYLQSFQVGRLAFRLCPVALAETAPESMQALHQELTP